MDRGETEEKAALEQRGQHVHRLPRPLHAAELVGIRDVSVSPSAAMGGFGWGVAVVRVRVYAPIPLAGTRSAAVRRGCGKSFSERKSELQPVVVAKRSACNFLRSVVVFKAHEELWGYLENGVQPDVLRDARHQRGHSRRQCGVSKAAAKMRGQTRRPEVLIANVAAKGRNRRKATGRIWPPGRNVPARLDHIRRH